MTVILTLFGLMVFVVSTFTVGFKAAFKRLTAFVITGLVIDVIIGVILAVFACGIL